MQNAWLFSRNDDGLKLSEDPNVWDTINLVRKQHFGHIIGKRGVTIRELQQKFVVNININEEKGICEIKGRKQQKEDAINEIR